MTEQDITEHDIEVACAYVRSQRSDVNPTVGLILGSGLGALADHITGATRIPYCDIPGFPQSHVSGHAGNLVLGHIGKMPVVAMQGRSHLYEGWPVSQATFPLRCMHQLGISTLIVSNASGGINPRFHSGQVVLIDDHINLMHRSAITENEASRGAAPTGVAHRCGLPYDGSLMKLAEQCAIELRFALARGTYLATLGPNYETRAEYRAFKKLGADMVGMSTVPEVIVAGQLGLRVLAFSIVTNVAKPDVQTVTDHSEVLDWTNKAQSQLIPLIELILDRLSH